MTEKPRITLNIGLRDKVTITQSSPDDFSFAQEVEDAINNAIGDGRQVVVTIGWKQASTAATTASLTFTPTQGVAAPVLPPERPLANGQKCIICDRPPDGSELYSKSLHGFIHQICLENKLDEDRNDPSNAGLLRVEAEFKAL
jgi:hypothetical protein